ncbi:hypothetical protein FRC07_003985 [Ceratobasidium sp. 392]|nr:hypothetical protein FRC07_003985 [Ceratobasidium sp. 392]
MASNDEDLANDLAESVLEECWNEFYDSYLPKYIEMSSRELYPTSRKIDLMDEELDRSVFDTPAKNELLDLSRQVVRLISYIDENELDIRDELIEPESQNAELWEERSVPKPVPGYAAYTPLRQSSYVRGDLWTDETGSDVQLPEVYGRELDIIHKRIAKSRLTNAETRGDMAHNQESMQFMPPELWNAKQDFLEGYIEEDLLKGYTEDFYDFEAWRDSRVFWENDEDIIELAVVQQLQFIHNMAPELIDKTGVLSRTVRALCKTLRNRVYPNIGTVYPNNAHLPPLPIDDILGTKVARTPHQMAVETALIVCHHPDCYAYMPCRAHYQAFHRAQKKDPGERGKGPLYPRFPAPKLTSRQLIAQTRREKYPVCENDCFQTLDASVEPNDSNDEIVVHVDESEPPEDAIAELELNWKQLPDAIPCDIATFGGGLYTCRQAYQMRNKMFPDMVQLESDDEIQKRPTKQKAIERKKLPALEECDHVGIVGAILLANNDKQGALVPRPQVAIHAKRIGVNVMRVVENAIRTYVEDVEQTGFPCKNTQLLLHNWKGLKAVQHYLSKETRVKRSQFGNGLFLAGTQAIKGDLIAEYTGEIVSDRTGSKRYRIYKLTGRNYLFDVKSDGLLYSIDAGRAGNETRFINHPQPHEQTNCVATWRYVGGVMRLGIYASRHIYNDQELFLNYGEDFFKGGELGDFSFSQPGPSTLQFEDEMVDGMMVEGAGDDDDDEDNYGGSESTSGSETSASL